MKLLKLTRANAYTVFARNFSLMAFALVLATGTSFAQKKLVKKVLKTNSNDATSLAVIPNGNVGIGTPNPQAKLDVQGDTKLTGNSINFTTAGSNWKLPG